MSLRTDQHFVIVRRESSRVTGIELFERVSVSVEEAFKARCGVDSRAFSIRISSDGKVSIFEVSCKDRPYFSFPWYEEKYICDDTLSLYEKVAEITDSSVVLAWLGQKL